MSCSLYWKPVVTESKRVGDIQLRDILKKKINLPKKLDYSDVGYLTALDDAGVKGAADLIEAITKHDVIEVYLEC